MKLLFNTKSTVAVIISILLLAFSLVVSAQTNAKGRSKPVPRPVSQSEREAFEKIIREYLLKNPTLIREALQELQAREEKERILMVEKNLETFRSAIYADIDSPVAGNKSDDVPIVVFYDYFCGYCRKNLPELQKLIAKDPSIRVIYKELPILGPQSHLAAIAALAANRQGKFTEFHQALSIADGKFDKAAIIEIAKRVGLDLEALERDMKDPKLSEAIARNTQLAAALNINGTPAYIVGSQIIPGAIDSDSLAKLVVNQRATLRAVTDPVLLGGGNNQVPKK